MRTADLITGWAKRLARAVVDIRHHRGPERPAQRRSTARMANLSELLLATGLSMLVWETTVRHLK